MKVHADISLVCMLYKCTIWSYLQDGYILLKEAYIANARNNASGTWILTSCATAVKFTYKARSVVEDLPLPHTCRHTHTHTCTYTSTYVDEICFPKVI